MEIEVVCVPVSDQARSKEFYCGALGCTVMVEQEFAPGQVWMQLALPSGSASISLVSWAEATPPGSLRGHVLRVNDIAAAGAALAAHGAKVGEVMDTPWGRFASFDDPDGNSWQLRQPTAEEAAHG